MALAPLESPENAQVYDMLIPWERQTLLLPRIQLRHLWILIPIPRPANAANLVGAVENVECFAPDQTIDLKEGRGNDHVVRRRLIYPVKFNLSASGKKVADDHLPGLRREIIELGHSEQ
ncbi:MAG: hypothetical protein M1822_008271 [Bathelium mastoideum]|nr:MAG: hypothetical protein M1822_008271 [Bathelium mastoideum]